MLLFLWEFLRTCPCLCGDFIDLATVKQFKFDSIFWLLLLLLLIELLEYLFHAVKFLSTSFTLRSADNFIPHYVVRSYQQQKLIILEQNISTELTDDSLCKESLYRGSLYEGSIWNQRISTWGDMSDFGGGQNTRYCMKIKSFCGPVVLPFRESISVKICLFVLFLPLIYFLLNWHIKR